MRNVTLVIVALVALLGYASIFTIQEGQRGIVIQFGKVKKDGDGQTKVYEPGLQFKVPVIDTVKVLDARLQTLDGKSDRFVTSEKKDLIIDSYVKWRINDFERFYLSTGGNILQAETLLQRKINNGLRSEIGGRTIKEIVSGERSDVMESSLKRMARSSELGIIVQDVRIKKINLPDEVSTSIYQRMRAERNAVAREHRSEGREKAEVLRAEADARVTVMLADAERNARQIRGSGDAEAAKIYAEAYGQNAEFYSFMRSLQAYRNSFSSKDDILVIQPDNNDFFRYMKDSNGGE